MKRKEWPLVWGPLCVTWEWKLPVRSWKSVHRPKMYSFYRKTAVMIMYKLTLTVMLLFFLWIFVITYFLFLSLFNVKFIPKLIYFSKQHISFNFIFCSEDLVIYVICFNIPLWFQIPSYQTVSLLCLFIP